MTFLSVDTPPVFAYNKGRKSLTNPTFKLEVHNLSVNTFLDSAKVMPRGQVTIPKDIREVLGIQTGDRVTFVVEGNTVRLVNSAVYAMQMLQAQMAGEAEKNGLTSDDDVMALVSELRSENEDSYIQYL